jgi:hypothetical protein
LHRAQGQNACCCECIKQSFLDNAKFSQHWFHERLVCDTIECLNDLECAQVRVLLWAGELRFVQLDASRFLQQEAKQQSTPLEQALASVANEIFRHECLQDVEAAVTESGALARGRSLALA